MAAANIIDISEENFEFEVVNYSGQMPVVMDFWAPWCIPCRVQTPMLVSLTHEAEGRFRLARVNVDEQPRLAERLKVRTVPSLKAFVDGRIVGEFVGVASEANLRLFIDRILPQPGDLLLEKGNSLLLLGDYAGAEETLEQYVDDTNGSPNGLLSLSRALLFQGKASDAMAILANFPASTEYSTAQKIKPVAKAYLEFQRAAEQPKQPLDAAFRNGIRLAMSGRIQMALDGFLDILRKDKHYRNGEVQAVYLGLLEVLGENHPETRQYRADLSNVLF